MCASVSPNLPSSHLHMETEDPEQTAVSSAGQSMAPSAQLLEMVQQPQSSDWLEQKNKAKQERKEERKEAKIDHGSCLFAFCSLSHGFQFYFTTARTKTSF